ncbi:MAG TPA: linear amide C-N hydrolase [Flavisolibacter sp.]|nr:linear amide C-N hydrolase [Flavisolibacter sp.]
MKKLTAILLLVLNAPFSFACSTFLLAKDGSLVFGRNYDWVSGNGMVVVNARGLQKTSLVLQGEKTTSWTSKCGSITFNQFGKEFPHGGINEKGLVVELMWLNETTYPDADGRGALNELQWIQYQLDNFATVDEVIGSNRSVRISKSNAVPLHYLVADASGNAATIEFINGQMVAHKGKDLRYPVLTNTPYAEALKQTTEKQGASSFENNSIDRFATACRMVQDFQKPTFQGNPVDYAFGILDKIAQGDYTKWKIVYDITAREIHFVTAGKRKTVALNDFDFACNSQPVFLDINSNTQGMAGSSFAPLSFEENKRMMQQSARESKSQVTVSETSLNNAAAYFRQVNCAAK